MSQNPLEIRPSWDVTGGLAIFAMIAVILGIFFAVAAAWVLGYVDQIQGSIMGPGYEIRELVLGFRGLDSARPVPPLHRFLLYVAASLPLPLAIWAGWASARPVERIEHIEGRQLVPSAAVIRRESQKIKQTGAGIRLGEFVFSMSREVTHVAIIGGTGSGKTTVIEPMIDQAIRRGDKAIILDVKGDFTARLGTTPALIAPWDGRGWAWEIGADIRGPAGAAQLAHDIIGEGEGANAEFRDSARQLMTAIIIFVMRDQGEKWSWQHLAEEIEKIGKDGGESLAKRLEEEYPRGRGSLPDGRARAGVLMSLNAHLDLVYQLSDSEKSAKNRFSIRRYISHKTKPGNTIKPIVIQASDDYKNLSRALLGSMLSAIRAAALSQNECPADGGEHGGSRRLWIFLDEIGQIGEEAVQHVVSLAEVGRSKGVRLVIGAQSWAQVQEDIGRDGAASLAQNIGTWLIGRQSGGADGGEEWASKKVGKRKISRVIGTAGVDGQISYQPHLEEVPICRPEFFGESGRLGADKKGACMLLLTGADPAIITIPRGQFVERRPPSVPAPWILGTSEHDEIEETTIAPASASAAPTLAHQRAIAPPEAIAKQQAAQAAPVVEPQPEHAEPQIEDPETESESEAIGEIADAIIGDIATGGICMAVEATAEVAGVIENLSTVADLATRVADLQEPPQPQPITVLQEGQEGEPEKENENPLNKLKRRAQLQREIEREE